MAQYRHTHINNHNHTHNTHTHSRATYTLFRGRVVSPVESRHRHRSHLSGWRDGARTHADDALTFSPTTDVIDQLTIASSRSQCCDRSLVVAEQIEYKYGSQVTNSIYIYSYL